MANTIRKCVHCEEEYNTRFKQFGFINECNSCGKEGSDKDTPRLGGVMHYECKTNPIFIMMSMESAKAVIKAGQRNGGQGTLRCIVSNKN